MKKTLLVVFMTLAFLVTGCAAIDIRQPDPTPETELFKVGVQYALIRYLADEPIKQERALNIVTKLELYTEQTEEISVGMLINLTFEWVDIQNMHPADQFALREVVRIVAAPLEQKVGIGVIAPEAKVEVKEFLDWLETAIRFASI